MEKESVPTLKEQTMEWGQRRPGHKYNIRMCLTGGIVSEIFDMGSERCWKNFQTADLHQQREKACGVFKLSGDSEAVHVIGKWEVRWETWLSLDG